LRYQSKKLLTRHRISLYTQYSCKRYAEYEATFGIDGELLGGSLPSKQFKLIQAWLVLHEEELYAAWNKAVQSQPFNKIEPLR